MVPIEADIAFDSSGVIVGSISHTNGSSEIGINTPGNYEVVYSVSASNSSQFSLFLNGVVVSGSTNGLNDAKQESIGHVVLTIDEPSVLALRNYESVESSIVQSYGGIQSSVRASMYIERLTEPSVVSVSTVPELLAALGNDSVNLINITPGTYDLSAAPVVIRTTFTRLQSTAPGAQIKFAITQNLEFMAFISDITLLDNTVYNVNKVQFYTTIDAAVSDANPGDTVLVFAGTYNEPSFLLIDKSLRLIGESASNTVVTFPIALANTSSLRIQSDDVTIENIHFIGPTSPTEGFNSLLNIPSKTPIGVPGQPVQVFTNITISNCIMEGGRRNAFILAENLSILGTTWIHTGNRNSLNIISVLGSTTIANNTFTGGVDSLAAMTFEGSTNTVFSGTITIRDNLSTRHSQYVLFNTGSVVDVTYGPIGFQNAPIYVYGNSVDHLTRSGSSVIFFVTGPNDFSEIKIIQIYENIFVNPNTTRLAVYLDYTAGGTSVPTFEQVKVFKDMFNIALPWGKPTDIVDPNYPVGYSTGAPVGITLTIFELVQDTVL